MVHSQNLGLNVRDIVQAIIYKPHLWGNILEICSKLVRLLQRFVKALAGLRVVIAGYALCLNVIK